MTDHIAADPAVPVMTGDHAGEHDSGGHNSPENITKEIRVYMIVFGALAVLTLATVLACYGLKLPVHYAIIVAVTIASLKGFLVAGFFMHLLTEKKLIYGILVLTVVFFAVLLWLPVHEVLDKF